MRHLTRHRLRLIGLWFLTFLVINGWAWFNILVTPTPMWLDAIFGFGLIVLLALLMPLSVPRVLQGRRGTAIAWIGMAGVCVSGMLWAWLSMQSPNLSNPAARILFLPTHTFIVMNSFILELRNGSPFQIWSSHQAFALIGGLAVLTACVMITAVTAQAIWFSLRIQLSTRLENLQNWLFSAPMRPGRWLMWSRRLFALLIISVVLIVCASSIPTVQRIDADPGDIVSGPDTPPVVRALLISDEGTLFAGTNGGGVYRFEISGDLWQPISTGLTNVFVWALAFDSDRGILYAGTESGLYRSHDDGASWRQATNTGFAPLYVWSLALDSDRGTIYAGTDNGVYRSDDQGMSLQSASTGLTNPNVWALALDTDRNILYAGTWGSGVYRSSDGGASWQSTSTGAINPNIWALTFDTLGNTLYAGTMDGVYRSDDGGTSWQVAGAGLSSTVIQALALGTDRNTLYAGTDGGGVYRSGDAGASWQPTNAGLENTYVWALALDANQGTLYAGSWGGGVYRSDNGGIAWQPVGAGLANSVIQALILDPGRNMLYAGTMTGVYRSDDGGISWQPVSAGLTNADVRTLALDPSHGTLYAGTFGGEVYRSDNGGVWWQPASIGLTGSVIQALVLDPGHNTLYAGTMTGVYRSDDGGAFWWPASAGLANSDVRAFAIDPNHNTLYAGTGGGGVYRYDNRGTSWQPASAGLTDSVIQALVLDPGRGILYASAYGGEVYLSTNGGISWQLASAGSANTSISTLTLDAVSGTLYAGTTGGVYRSDDGGTSWQPTSAGLAHSVVQVVALDPGRRTLYAGTYGGGVYRSEDRGTSWQSSSAGLTSTDIRALTFDTTSGRLYLGTNGDGVYHSDDGGTSWQPASAGLHSTFIRTLTLDADRSTLYAGVGGSLYDDTEGRVYSSDDGAVSWKLVARNVPMVELLGDLRSQHESYAFLGALPSDTLLFAPSDGGLLASWLSQHLPVKQGALQPQPDGSAVLFMAWGNTISKTILPPDFPRTPLVWAMIRMASHTVTQWAIANRTWLGIGLLAALFAGVTYLLTTLVIPLGIPPWATILARRRLDQYADPKRLDRAWPEWEARVRRELLQHGDAIPADLRGVPGPLRSYAIRRYYATYHNAQTLDLRGNHLRLLAGNRLRRWRRAWRTTGRALGAQPGLNPAGDRAIDQLATTVADTLGFTLGPGRAYEAVRAYQVEAPTLRLKLPRRFPLIFLADPRPGAISVQQLFDTVEVIKETGYFALVVPLEPSAPQVDVPARLREAVAQSPYVHDFVILAKDDVQDLLIARHPVSTLAHHITTQVDLTIVSPFVIRGPVPENMFFGREAEIRSVVERIPITDFAVVGNRRIGKTSLLQRVRTRLVDGKRTQVFFVDCQTVSSAVEFFAVLQATTSLALPEATPAGFAAEIQRLHATGPLPVLVLDEVDKLLAHEKLHSEALVSAWRTLAQNGICHFVFCGASGLARRLRDDRSAFFNFAEPMPLGYLSPETAAMVIKQPMDTMGITLEDEETLLNAVHDLTSGHPNLVQYVGKELVEAANQRQERRVVAADVTALHTSTRFVEYFLDTIWGEAGPLERLLTLLVPDESFQVDQIETALATAGVAVSSEVLDDALRMLVTYSILHKEVQTYHLVPRAFRSILYRTQDVERLVAQEKRRCSGETA